MNFMKALILGKPRDTYIRNYRGAARNFSGPSFVENKSETSRINQLWFWYAEESNENSGFVIDLENAFVYWKLLKEYGQNMDLVLVEEKLVENFNGVFLGYDLAEVCCDMSLLWNGLNSDNGMGKEYIEICNKYKKYLNKNGLFSDKRIAESFFKKYREWWAEMCKKNPSLIYEYRYEMTNPEVLPLWLITENV